MEYIYSQLYDWIKIVNDYYNTVNLSERKYLFFIKKPVRVAEIIVLYIIYS